jgi:hypothetical protein
MDFTFGIITNGENDHNINIMIDSVYKNNIPNFEIIIVGNTTIKPSDKITVFYFKENVKPAWITKKKNIIAKNAKYENIVLLHDYIKLDDNWYEGFLKFGNNFDWCVNKIINIDGSRFRDYTLFSNKVDFLNINYSPADIDNYFNENCLLPYNFVNSIKTNKYMYISGSYYVIKRDIALKHQLNENLCWGQGEDVELSKRLHANGIIIQCNQFSSVKLLKYKDRVLWEREVSNEKLQKFINYCNS